MIFVKKLVSKPLYWDFNFPLQTIFELKPLRFVPTPVLAHKPTLKICVMLHLQAQLVNYVQYRALIEGWNSWMWTHYTGMLIWKTQNPWPGLRGQMYDHLLDQTGAFFGIRCAAEPIHVQLNLLTYSIEVSFLLSWCKTFIQVLWSKNKNT
jgi:hypothetical protein